MSPCHGSAVPRLPGGMAFGEPYCGDAPSQGCSSPWDNGSHTTPCPEEGGNLTRVALCPNVTGVQPSSD